MTKFSENQLENTFSEIIPKSTISIKKTIADVLDFMEVEY